MQQRKENLFNKRCWKDWTPKNETRPLSYPKDKTIKLLGENREETAP